MIATSVAPTRHADRCAVHGRVACTDDADPRADRDRIFLANAAQEPQGIEDTLAVLALDSEEFRKLGADGDEHFAVAVVAQIFEGEVLAGRLVVADLNAEIREDRHVLVDLLLGESVGGDGATDHASRIAMGLENRYRGAGKGEILRRRDAGRSGADDRDLGVDRDRLLWYLW